MATETDVAEESPGAMLARMLAGQRTFLENVYSLMRFLETEVTKHGWDIVKNGGYCVTRNGMGRGLTNFASGDWVLSQAGIAFVPSGQAVFAQGVTNTDIPREGLQLLVFQVRWLDKSPEEPVVWYTRLLVEPEGSKKPRKWEDYQSALFARLEPEGRAEGARSGNVKPDRIVISGATIVFTGSYGEVPVTAIETQEDVVSQLVEPALGGES